MHREKTKRFFVEQKNRNTENTGTEYIVEVLCMSVKLVYLLAIKVSVHPRTKRPLEKKSDLTFVFSKQNIKSHPLIMVTITVTDPRIEEADTRSSFTSYLVSTQQGNSVRRRYSDFQWLYKRLQTEVPGAIVPIIPHTRTIMSSKKFDLEFIEERRRNLQEFLLEIAKHSDLCRAPSMTPFMLLALGTDLDDGKKKVEQSIPTIFADEGGAKPASSGTSSQPQLASARKGITNFLAKVRLTAKSQELLTTQDESQILALNSYVLEVHGNLKALTKASDALLKSASRTADAHNEIGVPIGLWRTALMQQTANQDDDVKDMMAGIVKFSDEMSSLYEKKHKEEELLFGHNIHKLTNTVSGFEIALDQRKKIQVDYTHIQNTLIEKNYALEKAQKNLKPPEVTDKLNSERIELESRIELEKKRFDEVTKRVIRDAEKCKPKLIQMLQNSFLMLAKAEVSYTTRMNEVSQQMISDLEKVDFTGADGIPAPPTSAPPGPPIDDMN
jgi:sorting nexin-1/2